MKFVNKTNQNAIAFNIPAGIIIPAPATETQSMAVAEQTTTWKQYWNVQDVSAYLGLHPNTIRAMANDGRLPTPIRFGGIGKYLWPRDQILALHKGTEASPDSAT